MSRSTYISYDRVIDPITFTAEYADDIVLIFTSAYNQRQCQALTYPHYTEELYNQLSLNHIINIKHTKDYI